ncbi:MAG: hypothetical protein SangKO_030250 [Sandaracinaceae bacterium]
MLGLSTCAEAQNGAGENARAVEMVRRQLEARDVREPRVLAAMRRVPRHRFVPASQRPYAYDDRPLPIGHEQTISQPYIVGLMTQLAELEPGDRVLEIGTGSGYQAAVLAELEVDVYTIEIVRPGRSASEPGACCASSATTGSTCASATGTRAGPSTPPSTP